MSEPTFIGLDVHARSVVSRGARGQHRRGEELQRAGARRRAGRLAARAGRVGLRGLRGRSHRLRPGARLRGGADPLPRGGALEDRNRPPASASRPTAATPCGWPSCCASASSPRCACRAPAEEGARDLVRAREDARVRPDARPPPALQAAPAPGARLGGAAWTQAHERWLASQRFAERGLQLAYEEAWRRS